MCAAVASAESAEEYKEQTRVYAENAGNAAQAVLDSHFSVVEIDGDFLLKYTY